MSYVEHKEQVQSLCDHKYCFGLKDSKDIFFNEL